MLRVWRFITILLVALTLGMAFCHAMELVAKMHYPAQLYLTLQRTLYVFFGVPVGASIEVGAVLTSIMLAIVTRAPRSSRGLAILGAVCVVLAHAAWWIWVNPANAVLLHAPLQDPSPDWIKWRMQWECAHLARFALQLLGFVALLWSILLDTRNRDYALLIN